jgi:hypothetical protein
VTKRRTDAVEAVGESLPQLDVVTPLACMSAPKRKGKTQQSKRGQFTAQNCSLLGRRQRAQRQPLSRRRPRTLVVEAVDAVDRGRLVVAAEDEEVFGVLDLVREQEANSLERLLAAVDIVSKEEVVGLGRLSKVKARTGQCVHLAESLERPRREERAAQSRRTRTDGAGHSTARGCRRRS